MRQSDPTKESGIDSRLTEAGLEYLPREFDERILSLLAERDAMREVAKVAQWTVENNAYPSQLKAALDAYHRTLLERPE